MAFRIAVAADRMRWRWERLAGGFLEVFRQGNVFLGALCFGAFLMLVVWGGRLEWQVRELASSVAELREESR